MARPAASAEVQPSGRRTLVARSNTAPGAGLPATGLGVPTRGPGFEQEPVVAVHDDEVAVADVSSSGDAPLDQAGHGARLRRDRVAGRATRGAVIALVPVSGPGDRRQGLRAGHPDERDAVGRRAEVGVQAADGGRVAVDAAAQPGDVSVRGGIDRRGGEVEIPPVVGRKESAVAKVLVPDDRAVRRDRRRRWFRTAGIAPATGEEECEGDGGEPGDSHGRHGVRFPMRPGGGSRPGTGQTADHDPVSPERRPPPPSGSSEDFD